MDAKLKGRIIVALRRLTYTYAPRNAAKAKQKVGKATYQCELCNLIVYTGEAKHIPQDTLLEHPTVVKGKVNLDHKTPVIPTEGFPNKEWDWNIYLERLFCNKEQFQVLCEVCHKAKTLAETQERKETRRK